MKQHNGQFCKGRFAVFILILSICCFKFDTINPRPVIIVVGGRSNAARHLQLAPIALPPVQYVITTGSRSRVEDLSEGS